MSFRALCKASLIPVIHGVSPVAQLIKLGFPRLLVLRGAYHELTLQNRINRRPFRRLNRNALLDEVLICLRALSIAGRQLVQPLQVSVVAALSGEVLVRLKRMGLLPRGQLERQTAQAPDIHLLAVVGGLLQAFRGWDVVPEIGATRSKIFLVSQEDHRRAAHVVKFCLLSDAVDVVCADTAVDHVQVVQCFNPSGNTVQDITAELFGQACIFTPDKLRKRVSFDQLCNHEVVVFEIKSLDIVD